MSEQVQTPTTLQEAIRLFTPEVAWDYVYRIRWAKGVVCPMCGFDKHSFLSTRKTWQCKGCNKQFSVKKGTIFEDSPIGLDKWLVGMWLICNAKNGVSSYEIHRALGVTQKSAWFMLHRIRLAMKEGLEPKSLQGRIEIDESYIGGKVSNMHKSKKPRGADIPSQAEQKVTVLGMLERDGKIITEVVQNNRRNTLRKHIDENVDQQSVIYTDKLPSYDALGHKWQHESVDHTKQYVHGDCHTNGLENFWSLFKRTTRGTYVSMDPVHLQRYLDEYCYRFNRRKGNDASRFETLVSCIVDKRLTYAELTGKVLPYTA